MGDLGSIPGLGRFPGGGPGNPLQYSCIEESHRVKDTYYEYGFVDFDHLTETIFVSFLHCYFFPLFILYSSERSHYVQPILKEWRVTLYLLVIPFFWLQSFPASGSFPMSRLSASGGQSIGASASASVLLMSIQGWFPLGLTGLICLLSSELSRVFSVRNTTIRKHQFFGAQPSLWSNSHIRT